MVAVEPNKTANNDCLRTGFKHHPLSAINQITNISTLKGIVDPKIKTIAKNLTSSHLSC